MKGRGSFQVEALLPLEVEGKKLCLENWPDEMHWMGVMFFHLEEVTCYPLSLSLVYGRFDILYHPVVFAVQPIDITVAAGGINLYV
jgi:hypothetical protein